MKVNNKSNRYKRLFCFSANSYEIKRLRKTIKKQIKRTIRYKLKKRAYKDEKL